MSIENFRNNIRDIITAYTVCGRNSLTSVAQDFDISRQTVRRIINGETDKISEKTMDKIITNWGENENIPIWLKAKSLYGADIVKDKVFDTGNRKETFKDLKAHRKEFNRETSKEQERWKDLTKEQKTNRGYSPTGIYS